MWVIMDFSTFFTGLTTNLSRDVDTAKAHALRMDCVSRQPSFSRDILWSG